MPDRPVSIDRLIDDVARAMSAGDTPSVRARVVADLGRQRRVPAGLLAPLVVLASAAAVAIATHWPPKPSTTFQPPMATTVARASVPVPDAPTTVATPPAPGRNTPRAAVEASTETAPDDGPSIAALPAIEAMPVSSIQPKALGVPQLSVEQVANLTPLSVPALDEINRDR